ncbi:MAG: PadR family transcriptional regulator [Eubacterium sp.]|nr:PadR family transcriptional regulator [Eubacterium sp.]
MENIILSMLILRSMTIYEIRGYIQKNLSSVCSDSLGSIQTAVKNLLGKGYIAYEEYQENGMTKKKYSITGDGVSAYKDWLGSPINISKMKNMEAGKLFFLGLAAKDKRKAFLKEHIEGLKEVYENLCAIKKVVGDNRASVIKENVTRINEDEEIVKNLLNVSGEKKIKNVLENVYTYQIYMLQYGLMRTKTEIEFYEDILRKE